MLQTFSRISQKQVYFILFILSFILYGNSIQNDYCLDDNFVVTANPFVHKGFAGFMDILQHPYAQTERSTLDFRPVVLLTFAIEQQFITDNPHVSHFINILLYAIALCLIYSILLRNTLQLHKLYEWLPLIIIIFYAIHPLHTEVVDSLKNRDELLALIFGTLLIRQTSLFYTDPAHRKRHVFFTIVLIALTLHSKFTGVMFVGFFILNGIFYRYFRGSKWNYAYLAGCILLTMRGMYGVLGDVKRITNPFENPLESNKDLVLAAGTASKILFYHIKMLVYPFPLRFYYGYNMFPLNSLTDPVAIISLLLHGGLLVYGMMQFFKRDVIGLIILFYFASIFFFSNFPVPYTGMFSERSLLVSSLWFISIIAVLFLRMVSRLHVNSATYSRVVVAVLALLFAGYSFATIRRNFQWKNNIVLMSHDIRYLQNSVLANYMFANNLSFQSSIATDSAQAKDLANKAITYYQHTIDLYPLYPETFYRLASAYRYNLNDYDKAEEHLKKAIALDSAYFNANFELAKLYLDKQDFRNSYTYFAKSYAIKPKDSLTLFYFPQVAAAVQDTATSFKINREFIAKYPHLQYPYLNMGKLYSLVRKDDSAVIYFEKAIQLGSRNTELLNQMAIYFDNKKDATKATYYRSLLKQQ